MKNKDKITEYVEEAMHSLDGISKAEANPFLYAKIQHRFTAEKYPDGFGKWIYRLAFILLVLLAANVFSYTSFIKNKSWGSNASGIEAFATEYNIRISGDNI